MSADAPAAAGAHQKEEVCETFATTFCEEPVTSSSSSYRIAISMLCSDEAADAAAAADAADAAAAPVVEKKPISSSSSNCFCIEARPPTVGKKPSGGSGGGCYTPAQVKARSMVVARAHKDRTYISRINIARFCVCEALYDALETRTFEQGNLIGIANIPVQRRYRMLERYCDLCISLCKEDDKEAAIEMEREREMYLAMARVWFRMEKKSGQLQTYEQSSLSKKVRGHFKKAGVGILNGHSKGVNVLAHHSWEINISKLYQTFKGNKKGSLPRIVLCCMDEEL